MNEKQLETDKNSDETELDSKENTSKIIINRQSSMASIAIAQMYSDVNFSDKSDKNCVKGPDVKAVAEAISEQENLLSKGDLSSLESMLFSQTHVLNNIFTRMVDKMSSTKNIDQVETFARIALKAQNQTRQAISTLGEIKGAKKTTFINQMNQAHNQQIINNKVDEKINKHSNEKGFNHVVRDGETEGTRENTEDKALVIPEGNEDPRGEKALSHECTQTWDALCQDTRARETVSRNAQTRKRSKKSGG